MLYGCRGNTLRWFRSYLTNRIQMCKIGHALSQLCYVKCGIPQGSNLEPLHFLIYINNLPNCLSSSTAGMFADNTNLTTNGKCIEEIQDHLNTDLEKVYWWLLANKLTLNKEKTEYMIIGYRLRVIKTNTDPGITVGEVYAVKQLLAFTFVNNCSLSCP